MTRPSRFGSNRSSQARRKLSPDHRGLEATGPHRLEGNYHQTIEFWKLLRKTAVDSRILKYFLVDAPLNYHIKVKLTLCHTTQDRLAICTQLPPNYLVSKVFIQSQIEIRATLKNQAYLCSDCSFAFIFTSCTPDKQV